jgi:deoxyribodipyrimidine photolyase
MDDLLREVLAETQRLSRVGASSDYEEFERLIEMRQLLNDAVIRKGALAPYEQQKIQEILQYDPSIIQYMQVFKNEAAEALSRLNTFKKQKAAYYHQGVYGSFMFDKRN